MENIKFSLLAISKEIRLFVLSLMNSSIFLGFIAGLIITVLVVGFVITKNPRNLPTMIRYSSFDSFNKLASRDPTGTYMQAYTQHVKMHTQVRMLMLFAVISFCMMMSVLVLTQ